MCKCSFISSLQVLQKNISREEDIVLDLRKQRLERDHAVEANVARIAAMQAEMTARTERINQLDQFAVDFKAHHKELQTLTGVLLECGRLVRDKDERLTGTLVLMAAFFAYCGHMKPHMRR
jgi:predicted membrane chloride channel (bestrophin family)